MSKWAWPGDGVPRGNPWREKSKVSPQVGKGYRHRQIAADVFHALIFAPISSAEYKIVLCVIEQTWGYQRKEHPISLSSFQKDTGLSRQSVRNAIHKVEEKRLIYVTRLTTKTSIYGFNKYYDTWVLGPEYQEWLAKKLGQLEEKKSGAHQQESTSIPYG